MNDLSKADTDRLAELLPVEMLIGPEADQGMLAIGQRLALTRIVLGYAQKEFAEDCGLGQAAYSQNENGKRRISVDQAQIIVEKHSLSFDWLYRGLIEGLAPDLQQRIRDLVAGTARAADDGDDEDSSRPRPYAALGERLRVAREALNISQAELARRLDITRATVSAWEKGFIAPKRGRVADLARELNISAADVAGLDLLDDAEPRPTFGDRVRQAREAAGLTQSALADALGLARTTVTQWENAVSHTKIERLDALADVLGVTVPWLLGHEGGSPIMEEDEPGISLNAAAHRIGDAIRCAREAKGISQTELALRLGVSRPAVTKWEHGITAPKRAHAPLVCEILGMSPASLLGVYDEEAVDILSPQEWQLVTEVLTLVARGKPVEGIAYRLALEPVLAKLAAAGKVRP